MLVFLGIALLIGFVLLSAGSDWTEMVAAIAIVVIIALATLAFHR